MLNVQAAWLHKIFILSIVSTYCAIIPTEKLQALI